MRALLLVDHGSRKAEANAVLASVRAKIEAARPGLLVEHAHMELSEPNIAQAVERLLERGARSIYLMPWFLAPGRHAQDDVPRLAREALAGRDVTLVIGEPMGDDELLVALALRRIG